MLRKVNNRLLLILLFGVILFSSVVFALQLPKWFPFQTKDALKEWEEKVFKGRVLYSVEVKNTEGYLSAYSDSTASGIFYRLTFSPAAKPMVSWKWKVIKFPDKKTVEDSSNGWIEKDDYAARFYVIFPGFLFSQMKCLEYVWARDLREGTVMSSPYFDAIKIIVVESGKKKKGKWVFEERNIYQDYKKVFGRPPGRIGGIAIMTDTDNTLSVAEAHYDEIRVGYKK
ncbi:MAG: DUF3047 domain-containing protein [Candidatus Omnitrophota bacterium]|nr:MAG: DUF3047 domain-containing protein [Candidatus Omnitrophota bacterium]